MSKQITNMFDEDEIVALLEQHRLHELPSGIEVMASRHGTGWYLRVPIGTHGGGLRIGRNGDHESKGKDLRPFATINDAFEAALLPANLERWEL